MVNTTIHVPALSQSVHVFLTFRPTHQPKRYFCHSPFLPYIRNFQQRSLNANIHFSPISNNTHKTTQKALFI